MLTKQYEAFIFIKLSAVAEMLHLKSSHFRKEVNKFRNFGDAAIANDSYAVKFIFYLNCVYTM